MPRSKKNKLKVVTVIGVIGSGKSTAMPLVAEALRAHPVEADNFFQTTNPFRDEYLNDLSRWSLANETWLTLDRAEMIAEEIKKTKKGSKDITVIDSGLVMSWAYMRMHLKYSEVNEKEWKLFARIFDQVENGYKSDTLLWLDVTAETALDRVKMRGRDYELAYYTLEYLSNLRESVAEVAEKMSKSGVKVIKVDEDKVGNIVSDDKAREKFKLWVTKSVLG